MSIPHRYVDGGRSCRCAISRRRVSCPSCMCSKKYTLGSIYIVIGERSVFTISYIVGDLPEFVDGRWFAAHLRLEDIEAFARRWRVLRKSAFYHKPKTIVSFTCLLYRHDRGCSDVSRYRLSANRTCGLLRGRQRVILFERGLWCVESEGSLWHRRVRELQATLSIHVHKFESGWGANRLNRALSDLQALQICLVLGPKLRSGCNDTNPGEASSHRAPYPATVSCTW